jgi:hypothetical protein
MRKIAIARLTCSAALFLERDGKTECARAVPVQSGLAGVRNYKLVRPSAWELEHL